MLEVETGGLLSTIQDGIGRPAAASLGVPRGGAADPWGLAVANLVLGNAPTDAAIEMTLLGPELRVLEPSVVGLGGADLGASVVETGARLLPGSSYRLEAGWTVACGERVPGFGVRGYLALPGGVDVPPVLGSASTCLAAAFGGFAGRPLRAGDRIRGRGGGAGRAGATWPGSIMLGGFDHVVALRVVAGPHASRAALDELVAGPWTVAPASDRMGVRLDGPGLSAAGRGDLVSLPMCWGAVQVPPDGHPIVLGVDGPTVGGYPVIAVVMSADRPLVGQLGPGDRVAFTLVAVAAAQRALAEQAAALRDGAARARGDSAWGDLAAEAGAWPSAGDH